MSGTTDPTERQAWIALASAPGVGDITFDHLLETFGSAAAALDGVTRLRSRDADRQIASRTGMRLRPGVAAAIRTAAASRGEPERRTAGLGGWTLTPLDAEYPAGFLELERPPAVLFGLGDRKELVSARSVAVVGTRRPTIAGRDLARRIGARLAEASTTVVSGLAIGIDGAAHAAALEMDGRTVAVVGGGLDAPGPAVHRHLAQAIRTHGAIVSELAPGVSPTRGTFPRRNRIISALSVATIVVEAPARSGALITARHALEQGRMLLVAPGRPLDPRVAGCLSLLRESPARPLVGLDEMVVDLGLDGPTDEATDVDARRLSPDSALALLGPVERSVATALRSGPQTVDALVQACGLEPGVVAGSLTMLQLRGWARVLGAMQLPAGPLL